MKQAPRLCLLDGSSFIYRAYFGVRDQATVAGLPTNAVFGFTRMLLGLLQEENPDQLAVVFDPPRETTFRRKIYPPYKANRERMPDDLACQVPYIRRMLDSLKIATLEEPGFEADDVIATLARRAAAAGTEVTVVSSDKDLLQIVEPGITLLDTLQQRRSGVDQVRQRFGVPPELVPDLLGLSGDAADNIPGVPGIGEKTAAALIQTFGSLEDVLKWSSLVNGRKRRESLQLHAEQARISRQLATVRDDLPLSIEFADLARRAPDLDSLIPLLRELEFEGLETAFTPPPPGLVEIYSDGSGRENGPGGYGVILRYGEFEKELSGFEPQATSQRMELLAAIRGLEALKGPRRVRLFSDSQYLVRGMSEWLGGWQRSGRLVEPGALANQDLWQQLAALGDFHQVTWSWVRGHAGHHFNERCDKLAKRASEEGARDLVAAAPEPSPLPAFATAVELPPVPAREQSDFDEEDGQLRLC
ncbi:DNA polymerase I [Desulfuromonas sp. DDH964]|uniref:RNase H family protein n=1 Tax=Desulfuromonas sp. DDH964 TaxID=1823759 RepID=UPI00078DE2EE|nr:RNase H family protein [Desulfuromonas sp. DDH964]AMV72314.1 DNA polymerase I [Desulfuromonas sp. DDH964]